MSTTGAVDGQVGIGVSAYNLHKGGIALRAISTVDGYALSADGQAEITANPRVGGTVSKAGGSFKIDHPKDPANKYLYHSFVESPDMMNVYNGVVTTDADGKAAIELPDWFETLNRDFRYQLTPIGGGAPELHISKEVDNNRFSIADARPNQKISWQITGIRQDAWANHHRIPVEETKPKAERGTYLHPEELGQPTSAGLLAHERARYV